MTAPTQPPAPTEPAVFVVGEVAANALACSDCEGIDNAPTPAALAAADRGAFACRCGGRVCPAWVDPSAELAHLDA